MNLFDFLYRGATVYVAAGQIYAEAESNASLLAIAEARQYMRAEGPNCAEAESNASLLAIAEARQYMRAEGPNCAEAESNASLLAIAEARQYMRPARAELRRSREQCKFTCNCLRRDSICGRAIPCGNACGRFFRYMYGARNQFSHKKAGSCKPLSLKRDNGPFLSCPNPCRPQERPRASKPNR